MLQMQRTKKKTEIFLFYYISLCLRSNLWMFDLMPIAALRSHWMHKSKAHTAREDGRGINHKILFMAITNQSRYLQCCSYLKRLQRARRARAFALNHIIEQWAFERFNYRLNKRCWNSNNNHFPFKIHFAPFGWLSTFFSCFAFI